ncbi:uncharacterized protein LOC142349983 [Convolutriloba macropyga]|uniref:uncharacterized protein LOC142349983 n=1 Tax=Convolutriloba macropyga TaxID=536237 RepID=UPI003F528BC9
MHNWFIFSVTASLKAQVPGNLGSAKCPAPTTRISRLVMSGLCASLCARGGLDRTHLSLAGLLAAADSCWLFFTPSSHFQPLSPPSPSATTRWSYYHLSYPLPFTQSPLRYSQPTAHKVENSI